MAKRDYYETLGVARGASSEEIKKAFRKKAKELHPDRNSDNPGAEASFKEVNEAYDILKDGEKKAAYDRFGHAAFEGGTGASAGTATGQSGFGGFDFEDVFEGIFGDLRGGRRGGGRRSTRGNDLRFDMRIRLEESYQGLQKTINVSKAIQCEECGGGGAKGGAEPQKCPTCSGMGKVRAQQGFFTVERTCPTCSGMGQIIKDPCAACAGQGRVKRTRSLSVNIPAGVETGNRVRLSGEGDAGMRGGPPGDLFIFIEVQRHEIFERDGTNLYCRVPVSMATAALGGNIEVPTIDGGRSRVKVPEGSQSGGRMRLNGKGMPNVRNKNQFGAMHIELAVQTPVNLTARQKELLAEFEKLSEENNPEESSFLNKVKGFWERMKG